MLKRVLLGAVAFAYLALVGVQAAHYHKEGLDAKPDSCAVCATADQAARQAANASPSLSSPITRGVVVPAERQTLPETDRLAASARAPPPAA